MLSCDATSFLAQQSRALPVIMIVIAMGTLVALVVLIVAIRRWERSRNSDGMGAALDGEATDLEPIPDATNAMRARYADLPGLNRMRGTVKAAYDADLDGRRLTVFHHNFTTMAGSTPIVVDHTVYACKAPDWPRTDIAPRGFFSRVAMQFGRAGGLMLENAAFNKAIRVTTEDEAFAVTLLSPDMQMFLLSRPDVRWRIDRGELVLIYRGSLKPKRVGGSVARLRRFWTLVPPELEAWTARYGEADPGVAP